MTRPSFTSTDQQLVSEWHERFDSPVAETPQLLTEDRAKLRVKLIREELQELEDALLGIGKMADADEETRLIEFADAVADLLVVVHGTAVEGGIDAEPVFDIVMHSNNSKLGRDGKPVISRGEELDGKPAGKILKGPDFWEPQERIRTELRRQGADL